MSYFLKNPLCNLLFRSDSMSLFRVSFSLRSWKLRKQKQRKKLTTGEKWAVLERSKNGYDSEDRTCVRERTEKEMHQLDLLSKTEKNPHPTRKRKNSGGKNSAALLTIQTHPPGELSLQMTESKRKCQISGGVLWHCKLDHYLQCWHPISDHQCKSTVNDLFPSPKLLIPFMGGKNNLVGLVLWHSILSHYLLHWDPIFEHQFKYQLLHFWSRFCCQYIWESRVWWPEYLGPVTWDFGQPISKVNQQMEEHALSASLSFSTSSSSTALLSKWRNIF